MLKKKILIAVFILSITIFVSSAFALYPPGTPFTASGFAFPGVANSWTQSINIFAPPLSSEQLIINSADLTLNLDVTPIPYDGGIYFYEGSLKLDGYDINPFIYISTTPGPANASWLSLITDPLALNALTDKQAQISLTDTYGTHSTVNLSFLHVTGSVAPEPISMVLFGMGIVGLPVAGRFRRFILKV
jgi:hypothetical protein